MKKVLFLLIAFISVSSVAQKLISDNPSLNDAFKLAVQTMDINTRRGILAAGGDYGGEWTRDIAINSWNGASLLRPAVAEKSLWSVTIHKDTIGHQYWDKIIWSIAAYNHYLVTGDNLFLAQAYTCSVNTMSQLEKIAFDNRYGLFTGPSVFNDGIAGYPEPVYEPANHSSGAMEHKNTQRIKCLSTNSVYCGAYQALAQMNRILNGDTEAGDAYQRKADKLKENILKYFYHADSNTFSYLIDQNGKVHDYQEGLGISFAVMFGILEGEKATQLIDHAVVSMFGITSITPDFKRYSRKIPGRHNNIIWPMVNGFYAQAAILSGNYRSFAHELFGLTHLALDADKGDYNFREIYNPNSGIPDGGYQDRGNDSPGYHWESCKLQTWSATAYISMVLNGLFGLRFQESSLLFRPFLPEGTGSIELSGLAYRDAILNISIKGKGHAVKSFQFDGVNQTTCSIASTLKGTHSIDIILQ